MYAKGSDEENWEEIEDWLEDHRKGKVQGGEETSKSVDLDSALGRLATLGKK
jgi:hypothetical protein